MNRELDLKALNVFLHKTQFYRKPPISTIFLSKNIFIALIIASFLYYNSESQYNFLYYFLFIVYVFSFHKKFKYNFCYKLLINDNKHSYYYWATLIAKRLKKEYNTPMQTDAILSEAILYGEKNFSTNIFKKLNTILPKKQKKNEKK